MDASLAASFRNVLRPLRSLGITAESLINAPAPNYALAQQIDPKDARIKSERFTYESSKGGGKVTGLLARPATDGIKVPAAVPYYGRQPAIVDVPKIKGSLLIHYAETDARINEGWPAYEKALKDAGIK